MKRLAIVGTIVVLAALTFLWAANCAGPRPRVVSTQLQSPAEPGDPYVARALVENQGGGAGTVSVQFRLLDAGGRRYEAEKTVHLEGHERLTVAAEINAPPSDYQLKASVDYPVR